MVEEQKLPARSLRPVKRDRLSWHQFAAEPERALAQSGFAADELTRIDRVLKS